MEHIHIVISEINIDDRPDIEVKSVLESIIEQIINESPKRKQEPEDENSVTKKAKTNLIQEQSSFSMGVCCGGYTKRRKLNRKSKKPTINRPRQPQIINNHKIIMEMVLKKEVELTSLFNNVNPFVLRLNVYKKAREIVEPKYDFSGKKYALIKIIIPVLKPDLLTYKLAYYNISPIAGDLFHWQVKLNEISRIKTLAQLTEFKPICEKQSFFPNKYFPNDSSFLTYLLATDFLLPSILACEITEIFNEDFFDNSPAFQLELNTPVPLARSELVSSNRLI